MLKWLRNLLLVRKELTDVDIQLLASMQQMAITLQVFDGTLVRTTNVLEETESVVQYIHETVQALDMPGELTPSEERTAYMKMPHNIVTPLGALFSQHEASRLHEELSRLLRENYQVYDLEIFESGGKSWLRSVIAPNSVVLA